MVAGMHFAKVISITAYWRYVANLWPMLLIFALVQLTMRLTGNSASIGLPVWISVLDFFLFLVNFGAASMWAQMPAAKCAEGLAAQSIRHHKSMETMMSELPLRALKAFAVSGIVYATYLMILMTVAAAINGVSLTPRMLLALGISFYFTTVVLAPSLGVANTIDYATRLRHRLADIGIFTGDLAGTKPPRILIGSVRRPWMVFTVTGFLPTSLLALYVYMALGVGDEMEQRFIIAQALVLFMASVLAGIYLVNTISNVLKLVTGELAKGVAHLRQGRFDGRVPVLMDDEMGELARGLNTALKGLQEREDMKDTLRIAAEIQLGLLPSQPPSLDHYSIHGFQQSCFAIGGDYFDHIPLPNGSYWLVIADVTGKGFPAALTVANLQAMLHALAASHPKIRDAAAYINTALCNTMTGGRFVTLFMAELHPADHQMLWLNAGHMPILVARGKEIISLNATSPPMGLTPDTEFQAHRRSLRVDDTFMCYTDGVIEARHKSGDRMFGEVRLREWFLQHQDEPLDELPAKLMGEMKEFGNEDQEDDITLLFLRREDGHETPH